MRKLALLLVAGTLGACGSSSDGAQFKEAKRLIAENCAGCHQVPGVAAARGRVGPSLAGIGHQQIIAGHFVNTPLMLAHWIAHPQLLLPGDAMPETGLTEEQAQSIATYLYSLD
jgi:cytochrome c1